MPQSVWVNLNHRALEKKDKIVSFVSVLMYSLTLVESHRKFAPGICMYVNNVGL